MDNPEKMAALCIQDTGRRQKNQKKKQKKTTTHKAEKMSNTTPNTEGETRCSRTIQSPCLLLDICDVIHIVKTYWTSLCANKQN